MDIREIKHEFFVYRNGAMVDTLKRLGMPHATIFGLDLPRLNEIASRAGGDLSLADTLWADKDVRESRLLACILYSGLIGMEKALELTSEVRTQEEADLLAFRVLKRMENPVMMLAIIEGYADAMGAGSAQEQACERCITALKRHLE